LAELEELAGKKLMVEGRAVPASECQSMWASLARPVAIARMRLGAAGGAELLRRCTQLYADAGAYGQAAQAALELAEACQGMDATDDAMEALRDAVVWARRKGDRDLQARAYSAMPAVIWTGQGALAALSACDSSEKAINGLLREVDIAPTEEFSDHADRALERGLVMWEALDLKRSRAEILAGAGGLPQAIAALDGVDVSFLDTGYVAQATEVLLTRGRFLAALHRAEEATAAWERAARLAQTKELGWMVHDVVAVWAGWLADRGEHAAADRVRREWLGESAG
jgi:tetratricopeptide (TPR) repeat protein